jgi:predicted ArsR family transcriptional regulator
MSFPHQSPAKEVDVAFLVFVERYATDLLKWDIITLFAHKPASSATASDVARMLGLSVQSVRPELGDLALLDILQQSKQQDGQTIYQLTKDPHLRKMALKFAQQMATPTTN